MNNGCAKQKLQQKYKNLAKILGTILFKKINNAQVQPKYS